MDDLPVPQTSMWDHLDDDQQRAVIALLARLITKMIVADTQAGDNHDR
jgi:hypothetical protein